MTDSINILIQSGQRIRVLDIASTLNISIGSAGRCIVSNFIIWKYGRVGFQECWHTTQAEMTAGGSCAPGTMKKRTLSIVMKRGFTIVPQKPTDHLCSDGILHLKNAKKQNHFFGRKHYGFFWDMKVIMHIDFPTEQRNTTAEYYSNLLKGPVNTAMRSKRTRARTLSVYRSG